MIVLALIRLSLIEVTIPFFILNSAFTLSKLLSKIFKGPFLFSTLALYSDVFSTFASMAIFPFALRLLDPKRFRLTFVEPVIFAFLPTRLRSASEKNPSTLLLSTIACFDGLEFFIVMVFTPKISNLDSFQNTASPLKFSSAGLFLSISSLVLFIEILFATKPK